MKKFLIAVLMSAAVWSPVRAADMAIKAPMLQPYDLAHCGMYFGVNTIGTAGGVNGVNGAVVAPGTQVVQGGIGGTLGYGCPIGPATAAGGQSFWFVEGMADAMNINGNANGLSLSGPASFTERFGAGTPLSNLISAILPAGTSNPAVPNLPVLPPGVTAGPGAPYLFVALHQTDVSASFGLANNREWMFSYGAGVGIRYRLSNLVVADTFAEYQSAPTQSSLCVGPVPGLACARFGSKAMLGLALLY